MPSNHGITWKKWLVLFAWPHRPPATFYSTAVRTTARALRIRLGTVSVSFTEKCVGEQTYVPILITSFRHAHRPHRNVCLLETLGPRVQQSALPGEDAPHAFTDTMYSLPDTARTHARKWRCNLQRITSVTERKVLLRSMGIATAQLALTYVERRLTFLLRCSFILAARARMGNGGKFYWAAVQSAVCKVNFRPDDQIMK